MSSLKASLKRIGWLSDINARYKAWRVKKSYRDTAKYYAEMSSQSKSRLDLYKSRGGIVQRLQVSDRPLRIFVLGTDEQQDRSGMLQALERVGRVNYFTRADGSYGQNDPAPLVERINSNTTRLWDLLQRLDRQGQPPDILIAQTWASLIDPTIFSRIRNAFGTFVINIAMDDRHQFWGARADGDWRGTFPLIPHLDLTLTAAPECVEWYQKEGCPALFFPEASDPNIFHPMPALPKVHDVCFVGARYGIREKIIVALRAAGIRVSAYGSGWENGRVDTAKVPRLFAQSRIILGVGTIGHCQDFYALKMRDFDGPMSGSCYVTHDNPDLHSLYNVGKEIITYDSIAECVQKVQWCLTLECEREQIARAGRLRALSDHTWEKRFSDLLELLRNDMNSLDHSLRAQ